MQVDTKSEFMALPKNEEGPLKNQEVRLTKLVPKMGKTNSEMDALKLNKLDMKKQSEDVPAKQKNLLSKIQSYFNKDEKPDDAGSEDIDEHLQDDELEVQNNDEKISSLEVNAKSGKKTT